MSSSGKIAAAALGLALAATATSAQAVSATERQILEDFFALAHGEHWLRSDGWLDPETHPCDWFGVECRFRHEVDREVIASVHLPGNRLSGTLDTRIFEIVHSELDLSDNRLGGALERLPRSPSRVDLSGNRFTGPIPDEFAGRAGTISGAWLGGGTWYLDLSSNDFAGELPDDWRGTIWLSLAGNRLEGMPSSLFEQDLHPHSGRFLDLSDNLFSGTIPPDLMDTSFLPHNGPSRWGGGLNLCWNDFRVEDPELITWIGQRHVGGPDFLQCLDEERAPLGLAVSGSWYQPDRRGEGVVVHQLPDDQALLYWFTFDDQGNQRWLLGTGRRHEFGADWRALQQTRGRFGTGFSEDAEQVPHETRGGFRLDHLGDQTLMAERSYIDATSNVCISIYPPPLSCFGNAQSDRLSYERLTELAGTTCESGHDFAELSGAWFNPDRDGEGFLVEVLPDRRVVVYWFTYRPDDSGAQAWMIGVGSLGSPPGFAPFDPTVDLSLDLYQPRGARFGAEFDPADIELLDWGELVIEFDSADSGWVEWNSHFDEFGSGGYAIERLTRPQLAECSKD